MSGYKIRLMLYSSVETWREIIIPDNITFIQLHNLIQKIFNFDDYHMWQFQIPTKLPDGESVDLNGIEQIIGIEESETLKINEIIEKNPLLLYIYDFGDNWEIVVHNLEKVEYNNKTAKLVDFKGKYSPLDDMGGIFVFEEIMEALDDGEDISYILDSYGMKKSDLTKMDFTKRYKKDSKILIK